jgi:hypothetical protein
MSKVNCCLWSLLSLGLQLRPWSMMLFSWINSLLSRHQSIFSFILLLWTFWRSESFIIFWMFSLNKAYLAKKYAFFQLILIGLTLLINLPTILSLSLLFLPFNLVFLPFNLVFLPFNLVFFSFETLKRPFRNSFC